MKRALDSSQFETLLQRLAPEREQAGLRYEHLRRRLISLFTYRGCSGPEDLADETLDRVARKLVEIKSFEGQDPGAYIFGIAWNVARESFHLQPSVVLSHESDRVDRVLVEHEPAEDDLEAQCLDECLERLPTEDRQLVLSYYQKEKRAKIELRSQLAEALRITPNALRLRVHRITSTLRQCVYDCVDAP